MSLAFVTTLCFGQTQRVELYEEFTGENCGPCAATNPAMNATLRSGSNPTKILSIKYESPIPSNAGAASLYGQDMTDVNSRMTYYNVQEAPYARFDGVELPDTTGGQSYPGWAGVIENYIIDTAYKASSPFSIVMTNTFSPMYDSVSIHVVITGSEAYSANGALYFRLAMEEAAIHLPAPTGTNGEQDFYYTMRQMLPNSTGTAIAGTWINGQIQTLDFKAAVPAYIYDKEQLCFVGFIQSEGDKKVQQAAMSLPQQMPLDAGVIAVYNIPSIQCTTGFTAMDTIRNYGSTTLTSCTINYQLDGGAPATLAWSGSVAAGGTGVATLPLLNATSAGMHKLTVSTTMPNGTTDLNPNNNACSIQFITEGASVVAPMVEGFQGATFPPAGWGIENLPASSLTWSLTASCGGFGGSTACSKMDFYDAPPGNVCRLYTHNIDLSASATAASITFNVAYAPYDGSYYDQLDVEVSTDCGLSWSNVYSKSNTALATAPANTGIFKPTAAQWRTEKIDITSACAGKSNAIARLIATSGNGNNLYLDDVNLSNSPMGISENKFLNSLNVYPNPFSDNTKIAFSLMQPAPVRITVYNMLGEVVFHAEEGILPDGENVVNLSGCNISNGIYFVAITAGSNTATQKVSISR